MKKSATLILPVLALRHLRVAARGLRIAADAELVEQRAVELHVSGRAAAGQQGARQQHAGEAAAQDLFKPGRH